MPRGRAISSQWLIWWLVLCAATAVNVAGWSYAAATLPRREPHLTPETYARRRMLLWLAAVYVLGCGFRSVFPMVDVPRLCLHETWFSRIFVGRSVATVAELCFAMQWAIVLREAAAPAGSRFTLGVARIVVPIIVAAELFSWTAVLTTNYFLHAIENSLWALAAVLAIAALASARSCLDERSQRFAVAALICGAGYIAYMVIEDVPMYLSRWQADLAAGRETIPAAAGLREILERCTVVRDWVAWRQDVPWLTLYFTVAVWISITLAHTPPLRRVRP